MIAAFCILLFVLGLGLPLLGWWDTRNNPEWKFGEHPEYPQEEPSTQAPY